MKMITSINNGHIPDSAYKRYIDSRNSNNRSITDLRASDIYEENGLNRMNASKTNTVLSFDELTTLHLLFGSEKPDEMTFYGHNVDIHINKGQLFDVTG